MSEKTLAGFLGKTITGSALVLSLLFGISNSRGLATPFEDKFHLKEHAKKTYQDLLENIPVEKRDQITLQGDFLTIYPGVSVKIIVGSTPGTVSKIKVIEDYSNPLEKVMINTPLQDISIEQFKLEEELGSLNSYSIGYTDKFTLTQASLNHIQKFLNNTFNNLNVNEAFSKAQWTLGELDVTFKVACKIDPLIADTQEQAAYSKCSSFDKTVLTLMAGKESLEVNFDQDYVTFQSTVNNISTINTYPLKHNPERYRQLYGELVPSLLNIAQES